MLRERRGTYGYGGRERVYEGTEGKERGCAGRREMCILRERGDIKGTDLERM